MKKFLFGEVNQQIQVVVLAQFIDENIIYLIKIKKYQPNPFLGIKYQIQDIEKLLISEER